MLNKKQKLKQTGKLREQELKSQKRQRAIRHWVAKQDKIDMREMVKEFNIRIKI